MATKHEQILQYITSLPVGEKISVRQIAKDINVSEGTAYRAIKDAENKGYVSTIERVGTIRIETTKKENFEKRLTADPEHELVRYDLVFATARMALEAICAGCAVIVCDSRGTIPELPIGQSLAADLDHGLHVRAGLHMVREHRDQRLGQLRVARNPVLVSLNILTRVGVVRAGNLGNCRGAHSWPPVK